MLLLPGGDGEDDIDIGGGVLSLGGVHGLGHDGGVVVRGDPRVISGLCSNMSSTLVLHLLCKSQYESSNPEQTSNLILSNIHFSE